MCAYVPSPKPAARLQRKMLAAAEASGHPACGSVRQDAPALSPGLALLHARVGEVAGKQCGCAMPYHARAPSSHTSKLRSSSCNAPHTLTHPPTHARTQSTMGRRIRGSSLSEPAAAAASSAQGTPRPNAEAQRLVGFRVDGVLDEPLGEPCVWSYAVGHVLNDASAACWFSYLLVYLVRVCCRSWSIPPIQSNPSTSPTQTKPTRNACAP